MAHGTAVMVAQSRGLNLHAEITMECNDQIDYDRVHNQTGGV